MGMAWLLLQLDCLQLTIDKIIIIKVRVCLQYPFNALSCNISIEGDVIQLHLCCITIIDTSSFGYCSRMNI